ncbi:MAG: RDD family protein [Chloroflexi bacterium]|nr:RDD family protein [Chloroflexota bacterium]
MSQLDEPAAELAPAAHLRRLAAFLLDIVLWGLLNTALVAAGGAWLSTFAPSEGETSQVLETLRTTLIFAPVVSFSFYSIAFWGSVSTSPGKWLVGLQLIRIGGGSIGMLRGTLRLLVILGITFLGVILGAMVQGRAPLAHKGLPWFEFLVLVLVCWLPALVRVDHAGLHDLIAGTREVQTPQSGLRLVTRGAISRSIRDARWAAVLLLLLAGSGTGIFVGVRSLGPLSAGSQGAAGSAPVDAVTQETIKGAILEYDRMEEHATFRLDASILEPRATQSWLARKSAEFAEMRRRGLRQESRLIEVEFKAFRWVDTDRVEADVIETWVSVIGDSTGRVLQERAAHEVPQTAVLERERGRWKLSDVRQYEVGEAPF